MTQIRSTRHRTPRPKIKVQLSSASPAILRAIHGWYAQRLGRPVSNSVVVRRALSGLLDHLDSLPTGGAVEAQELSAVLAERS